VVAAVSSRTREAAIGWLRRNGYTPGAPWLPVDARHLVVLHNIRREEVLLMTVARNGDQLVVAGITLVFGNEPPPPRVAGEKWRAVTRALQEHAGQWACLGPQNLACPGRLKELGCEAVARTSSTTDREHPIVWARWRSNGATP
jgi:hypothetical protein